MEQNKIRSANVAADITRRCDEDMAYTRRAVKTALLEYRPELEDGAKQSIAMLNDLESSIEAWRQRNRTVTGALMTRYEQHLVTAEAARETLGQRSETLKRRQRERTDVLATSVATTVAEAEKLLRGSTSDLPPATACAPRMSLQL
jgi:predicted nucleic acid-binding Zn ribbon protein